MLIVIGKNKYEKIKKLISKKLKKEKKRRFFAVKSKNIHLFISSTHPILENTKTTEKLKKDFPSRNFALWSLYNPALKEFHKQNVATYTIQDLKKYLKQKKKGALKWWKYYAHKKYLYTIAFIVVGILIWFHGNSSATRSDENISLYSQTTLPINFSSLSDDTDEVLLRPILSFTEMEKDFQTTGLDFEASSRAEGYIEVSNYYLTSFNFIPKTQLMTSDGVSFMIQEALFIPRATQTRLGEITPGKTKVKVEAKVFSDDGRLVGSKGNINQGTKLKFSKLQRDSEKIFATAVEDFQGGDDNIIRILGEKDTENFRHIFEKELKEKAKYELGEIVNYKTLNSEYIYKFIDFSPVIEYENAKIETSEYSKTSQNIELRGTIRAEGYYYDFSVLESQLKAGLRKNFGNANVQIDPKSIELRDIKKTSSSPKRLVADVYFEYSSN